MGFSTSTCTEFVEVLSSKAPVPGGGGASALVGAVGTALGNMVGSLTVGKKKYADVEDEMWELKKKCDQLQKDFLHLIERDAEVFEPLSKAYGMPRETEEEKAEKARVMEAASRKHALFLWRSWRNAARLLNLSLSSEQKVLSLQSVMLV